MVWNWLFGKKRVGHADNDPQMLGTRVWLNELREVCERYFDNREEGQRYVRELQVEWEDSWRRLEIDDALKNGLDFVPVWHWFCMPLSLSAPALPGNIEELLIPRGDDRCFVAYLGTRSKGDQSHRTSRGITCARCLWNLARFLAYDKNLKGCNFGAFWRMFDVYR